MAELGGTLQTTQLQPLPWAQAAQGPIHDQGHLQRWGSPAARWRAGSIGRISSFYHLLPTKYYVCIQGTKNLYIYVWLGFFWYVYDIFRWGMYKTVWLEGIYTNPQGDL